MAKSLWDRLTKEAHRELAVLVKQKDALLSEIERFQAFLGGGVSSGKRKPQKRAGGGRKAKGKRVRRSADDLKKTAEEIVAFVKQHGEAKPKEIAAKFGKMLPSPAAFVQKHAGIKLKTKGQRSKTIYHV